MKIFLLFYFRNVVNNPKTRNLATFLRGGKRFRKAGRSEAQEKKLPCMPRPVGACRPVWRETPKTLPLRSNISFFFQTFVSLFEHCFSFCFLCCPGWSTACIGNAETQWARWCADVLFFMNCACLIARAAEQSGALLLLLHSKQRGCFSKRYVPVSPARQRPKSIQCADDFSIFFLKSKSWRSSHTKKKNCTDKY